MKILSGSELAGYIKERQAKQVRGLRQAWRVFPKLVIMQTVDNPVIDTYVKLKQRYGEDILVDVEVFKGSEDGIMKRIAECNQDDSVHGIIVQLPLTDSSRTDEVVNAVEPAKDVDALGVNALFDAATPTAINWLLAGYNIDLRGKKIVIVGNGRLVGRPLMRMWQNSGHEVTVVDETVADLASVVKSGDIIVSAVGRPGLITSDMIQPEVVVVDAATSSENGKLVGDIADAVRERNDLTITPVRGGVGPLTVCALFDNVIKAARATIPTDDTSKN